MNSRDIILKHTISASKGEESLIEQRQRECKVIALAHKITNLSLLGVPILFYFAKTKKHTGRTTYRNLAFFNVLLFMFAATKKYETRRKLSEELKNEPGNLNEKIDFYLYAVTERN